MLEALHRVRPQGRGPFATSGWCRDLEPRDDFRGSLAKQESRLGWTQRQRPFRSRPSLHPTISSVRRNSRGNPSSTRARPPRMPSPLEPHAAVLSTPPWPSWTPAPNTQSVAWRQAYSLLLGLERLLSEEEPQLADGTTLTKPSGRCAVRHADRAHRRGAARRGERKRDGVPARPSSPNWPPRPSRARRRSTRPKVSPTRSRRTGTRTRPTTRRFSWPSSPRTPTPRGASGSSTPPARARRSPRSASSRPRAPAAS